jgi:hypothetical protein
MLRITALCCERKDQRMSQTSFKACVALVAVCLHACPVLAEVLITPREAKLPNADLRARGAMSGPRVSLTSPSRDATSVKSPFALTIKFESRDGVPVDLNSLVVTYEKAPPVDLTERVKAYLTPTGITMPQAETPPGEHRLHIEIKDVNGRLGGAEFSIVAVP